MMSDETERDVALAEEQIQDRMGPGVDVNGDATPGHRVEIEYSAGSGGAWRTSSPTTISGELLYVEEYGTDSHQMVVRDDDSGRSVRFTTSGRRSLKSLAARKTRVGRSLGKILTITFTDEDVSELAPVMNVLRSVIPGDTVVVNGTEYGVVSTSAFGPEGARDKHSAVLTTRDGEEHTLEANAAYSTASATFSPRWGDDEDVDPHAVSVGRVRERYFDRENEGLNTDDTTDAFPAPHGAREGERVTFTLTGENVREDHPEEQVSGEVTDVRYFTAKKSSIAGMPEEQDPETTVELDDGRKVTLRNASRRGSSHVTRSRREEMGDGGMVRAMVVTYHEDADSEFAHVEAVDIQPEDASEDPERTDGGRVMADGGEDVDALAGAVSSALASSDLAMSRVSVSVGDVEQDVTIQANGWMDREDWTDLRDAITDVLDANAFTYTANPEWAFVRVEGREVRTDGGQAGAREPEDVPDDRHADVKQRVIALDPVVMVKTVGERGEYVAVYRSEDAGSGWRNQYETLMDLADYRSVEPYTALDEDPGGVTGEDITLDVWERRAATDGGVVRADATERGGDTTTMMAMSAVYAAMGASEYGERVTVQPRPNVTGCSIRYQGAVGRWIRHELFTRGLETREGYSAAGPEPEDISGTIHVTGFANRGDGDE